MKIIDTTMLRRFSGPGQCEVCLFHCMREAHHICKRGFGGGSRLDVAINLMGACLLCHRCIEDATPIQRGHRAGAGLREEEQFEIVRHREKIAVDVDIQKVVWFLKRLPKDPGPWVDVYQELNDDEWKLALKTLNERWSI